MQLTDILILRMFQDPMFSDLLVKCGPKEFKCHRGILCQRNEFSKACCVHGFKVSLREEEDVS